MFVPFQVQETKEIAFFSTVPEQLKHRLTLSFIASIQDIPLGIQVNHSFVLQNLWNPGSC
jgi:hypothetical protein